MLGRCLLVIATGMGLVACQGNEVETSTMSLPLAGESRALNVGIEGSGLLVSSSSASPVLARSQIVADIEGDSTLAIGIEAAAPFPVGGRVQLPKNWMGSAVEAPNGGLIIETDANGYWQRSVESLSAQFLGDRRVRFEIDVSHGEYVSIEGRHDMLALPSETVVLDVFVDVMCYSADETGFVKSVADSDGYCAKLNEWLNRPENE